ncbi:hypothetical protein HaLaN_07488 [Haematococcus lacustris]|uniref:Uncharacterized protein n=1 Tax=Haematococcus lacustris TaxID=44745 RepID=A0A699YY35_HAELA|nr:hypothetical protein HaLaN_07488 [Haematococcus lacustris]
MTNLCTNLPECTCSQQLMCLWSGNPHILAKRPAPSRTSRSHVCRTSVVCATDMSCIVNG